jgi:hypothetical protein
LEKEVKDLRKQIETLEAISDSIAQNVTLLVQNNYPKPEPVVKEEEPEPKEEAKSPYSKESVITEPVKEDEVVEVEQEEVITNPMRLDKDGWEHVSQAFVCHGCENKAHNGYQKYGTQLCETCRTGMAEQDIKENIVKEESQSISSPPLRSIEDIVDDV